jgi:hypothetical protein
MLLHVPVATSLDPVHERPAEVWTLVPQHPDHRSDRGFPEVGFLSGGFQRGVCPAKRRDTHSQSDPPRDIRGTPTTEMARHDYESVT